MPHKDVDYKETIEQMAMEEAEMAKHMSGHAISKKSKEMFDQAYAWEREGGHWLSKGERRRLSLCRKSNL